MTKTLTTLTVFILALVATASISAAAEIKVWTASAIGKVLRQIGPQFEAPTGNKLMISDGLRDEFFKRIEAGEPFDVLILPTAAIDGLIGQDKIIVGSKVVVARSGIGVEVRAGVPKPDISSVETLKRTLMNAKSIAYLRVGSGEYIAGMLEKIGIADAIKEKVVRPATDIVSELVAKG
jgi:molybdate transport system substrate-binding protein